MRKLVLLLMLILLAVPAYAEDEGEIFSVVEDEDYAILNPDIDIITVDGDPYYWEPDCWDSTEGYSLFGIDADGYSGDCLRVENVVNNDARYIQEVELKPGALYRISCMARAEGISDTGIGANISVKGLFCYSDSIYDTGGEWVELVLYGRVNESNPFITLCARVGGYSGVSKGVAWFDSFKLEEIDALPAGCVEYDLTTQVRSEADAQTEDENSVPARHTETWLLVSFGIALAALAMIKKSKRGDMSARAALYWLIGIFASALAVRYVLAFLVRGYYVDMNCFMIWSEHMFNNGFSGFYADGYFCDYPPAYMAWGYVTAALRRLFGIAYDSRAHAVLLKTMPIICDMAGIYLIYSASSKRLSKRSAIFLTAAYALNPAIFVNSAGWGQIDSVFTLVVVLGAVMIVSRKHHIALPLFALAMLIKPQALLFAPLGLVVLIAAVWRNKENNKDLYRAFAGLGAALALIALFAVVFHERSINPFKWIYDLYLNTMNGYPRITVNAYNLYTMLGFNWDKLDQHAFLTVFSWIMFAAAYIYTAILAAKAKRASAIYVCGAALIMLICAFGPMIHERYAYPALMLLMLAYCAEKDKNLLVSAAIMSVTLFMNEIIVLQGGMTKSNYGHLIDSELWLNAAMSSLAVMNALYAAYIAGRMCLGKPAAELEEPKEKRRPLGLGNGDYKLNLKRIDYIIIAAVTLAYSVLTFVNLGDTRAPQTSWVSEEAGSQVVFDLGETRAHRMLYYGGICNSTFTVELSNDGVNWTEEYYALYKQGEIFCWHYYVPMNANFNTLYIETEPTDDGSAYVTFATAEQRFPYQTARYVRITALEAGLVLSEIGFRAEDGSLIDVAQPVGTAYLTDEQDAVPERPSYMNSMYFDEIYHARTAYEHLHGLHAYEWTHPPLGKVIMMLGIELFGMTPFGWRFMGALAGVLMLPLIYLMVKQLGLKTKWAALAMALMALDSMHFTQTRIATIDSYAVFFIMLMYLFMFRYVKMSFHKQPLWKTLLPLMLCGVAMGCAWATKWIGFYASAGLAIIFFWSLITRAREYFEEKRGGAQFMDTRDFWKNTVITLGVCVIFFIVIPCLIYYFSYYWQFAPDGGLSIKGVAELQKRIFNYHSGLGDDDHSFRSPWYEWPVIAWPIWFYSGSGYLPSNMITSISCMGNPAVWWTGLAAMLYSFVNVCRKKFANKNYLIIVIGFLSQYLPWVLVPRSTFIYHYFASVPFIIIATALCLNSMERALPRRLGERKALGAADIAAIALVSAALILFSAFYPLESGLPTFREYAKLLRWFNWYNY